MSPEKQFLMDIEFDGRPTLNTNGSGVPLTADQKSAIAQEMGERKTYLKAIRKIMQSTDGKAFREAYKRARNSDSALDVGNWDNVHYKLNKALRKSITFAISKLDAPMRAEINDQQFVAAQKVTAARRGDVEKLEQLRQYNNY